MILFASGRQLNAFNTGTMRMEIVSGIVACLGLGLTYRQFQTGGPTYDHDDEKIPLLMEAVEEDELSMGKLQRQERMARLEAHIQRGAKQAAEALGLEQFTEQSEEDQASTCHYCGHLLIKSCRSQL